MKEILLLLVAIPVGLLVVLSNGLHDMSTAPIIGSDPSATPVVIVAQQVAPPIVVPLPTPVNVPAITANPDDLVGRLLAAASTWLGTRYEWGGCSKLGVDCSCFVQNAFAAIGVRLPRTTVEQIKVARPVTQPAAGDLVFFDNTCSNCGLNPTHVGLVIRPGVMIDAGDPVNIEPIYGGHNARYGRVL